mgnify:CR=1 FL=1
MEKREKIIKIRVSESEYEELVLRSSKPKLAQWMREFCLDAKVPRANKIPKVDPNLLRQIAAIGNNLNQIARQMNIEKRQPIDRVLLTSALASIERQLSSIKKEHTGDC